MKNIFKKFIEEIEKRGGWSTQELKEILLKLLAEEYENEEDND